MDDYSYLSRDGTLCHFWSYNVVENEAHFWCWNVAYITPLEVSFHHCSREPQVSFELDHKLTLAGLCHYRDLAGLKPS